MEDKFHKTQLCWTCARACGGCSWSAEFKPVRGWKAKKTILYNDRGAYNSHTVKSYNIKECPMYKPDTQTKRKRKAQKFVKKRENPFVIKGTARERILQMPDIDERLKRLTGENRIAAELAFIYNHSVEEAASAMYCSRSVYVRRLTEAMKQMEAMA